MSQDSILIVDDNATNIKVIASFLRDAGLRSLVAKSGEACLNILEKATPNLILLDVVMPHMDGYETCQRMKEKNNEVDIVFVSSNDSTEEIMKGFEMGGNGERYIVGSENILIKNLFESRPSLN